MRLHAGVVAAPSDTRCRALVGGFGLPAMRDLDFGRQFVGYAEALDWPADVVVEDLSYAPHLVLHRLQELDPANVVFVGSVERGVERPGTVRRYRLDPAPPDPGAVHLSLTDGLAGVGEFHHTLRVLRHWGALPADTVIIEVEPADTSFGLGFSEEVGSSIEQIVDVVRAELGCPAKLVAVSDFGAADGDLAARDGEFRAVYPPLLVGAEPDQGARGAERPVLPSPRRAGIADLARYAGVHDDVSDAVASIRAAMLPEPPHVDGLSMAARSRPFGTGLHTKGDWYDFIPLADGWFGVAMGDVTERGLEAAIVMSHLRSAVRASALRCGLAPGNVVADVDHVVTDTGLGAGSTLIYLAVNVASGEVRLANAGHCRPLLLPEEGSATFVAQALSPRLGGGPRGPEARPEATLRLSPPSSLLLYTDGLLAKRSRRDDPLQRLSRAAAAGPREVGQLCDHVASCCLGGARRHDDASLIVLRLTGETAQP